MLHCTELHSLYKKIYNIKKLKFIISTKITYTVCMYSRVDRFRFFLRILNWHMWHVLRGGVKITCSNSELFLSAPSIYANPQVVKKVLKGSKYFFIEIGHVGYLKIRLFVLIRLSLLAFSLKIHLKRVKLKKVTTFILCQIFDQKTGFFNFTLIGCIF